jgi:hypothetical protein
MALNAFVYQLVYGSIATRPLSSSELGELLRLAREKNARLRITGVLLYQDAAFLQALEGDEAAVRALYGVIAADPRHSRTTVVWSGNVASRSFGDWSMGFASAADAHIRSIEGYRDFFGQQWLGTLWSNSSRATDLLREFRNLPWRAAIDDARRK